MKGSSEDIIVEVSTDDLWGHSPMASRIWLEQPEGKFVVKHGIRRSIERAEFEEYSYQNHSPCPIDFDWHIRRVAWLAEFGWSDPIEISIRSRENSFTITDGNHRLVAAIYRGDPTIKTLIYGDCEYAPNYLPSLKPMANRCSCVRCNTPLWLMSVSPFISQSMLDARCLECGAEVVPATLI